MFKVLISLWVLALLAIILRAAHVVDCSWIVALIPLWVTLAVDIFVGGLFIWIMSSFRM
jgi:hypothetical protein